MADRLHLQSKHRQVLETLLRKHLPGVEVWAYGSRVSGKSHDGSDLDLVLRGPGLSEIPPLQLGDFEEAVQESSIPFLVEVRDWARLPERFHQEIERDHVVINRRGARRDVSEWREATLGAVTKFLSGGTPSKDQPEYWNGSIPWVSAKDMKHLYLRDTEDHVTDEGLANGTRKVPTGTVLLLARGMRLLNELPVCVTQQPMTFNQDIKALQPRSALDPSFLPYLVLGNKNRMLGLVDLAGHGTGRLNTDELKALNIQLPPVPQQRAIAHILGTLDDKIELNRRMNETLETMARALFKSWFVDFDPVRAKMEGRDPGLPQPLADLFPHRLVDSELGEIPEGWEVRPLVEHVTVSKGLSYKGAGLAKPDSGMPLHNLNSIKEGGGYKSDGLKYYSGKYRQRHVIQPGDLIVANTEQGFNHLLIGYSAIVPKWSGRNALFSHHIFLIKMMPQSPLSKLWLHYAISASWVGEAARRFSNGTTVNMLPADAFNLADTIVPPRKLVDAFSKTVDPMLQQQEHAVVCLRNLAALRDALLPKLMSGDLRVPGAWKMVKSPMLPV
ncbi:MAG: restriction endonuclease subunit S [Gammaproteobacteria bacterium]|nr:restriction endonuclease subunit S [Gammaproteobacteria bacterium]